MNWRAIYVISSKLNKLNCLKCFLVFFPTEAKIGRFTCRRNGFDRKFFNIIMVKCWFRSDQRNVYAVFKVFDPLNRCRRSIASIPLNCQGGWKYGTRNRMLKFFILWPWTRYKRSSCSTSPLISHVSFMKNVVFNLCHKDFFALIKVLHMSLQKFTIVYVW